MRDYFGISVCKAFVYVADVSHLVLIRDREFGFVATLMPMEVMRRLPYLSLTATVYWIIYHPHINAPPRHTVDQ